jgi:hypothetical protein
MCERNVTSSSTLDTPRRSFADPNPHGRGLLAEPLPKLLVLNHLMVRDSLAGHRDPSLHVEGAL